MRTIEDLEHFVLQPGELLILRPRAPYSNEQMQRMQATLAPLGKKILLLPCDVEVLAGELVLMGAEPPPEPTQEDIEAARAELILAYNTGKTLWAWENNEDGWFVIHRTMSPHKFEWDKFKYSLKPPPKS